MIDKILYYCIMPAWLPSHGVIMFFIFAGAVALAVGAIGTALSILGHPVLTSVWNWLTVLGVGASLILFGDLFEKSGRDLEEYRNREK